MKPSDTTWAVGTPKNSQLSWRNVSSANRTTPYQTKKTSRMSPGRSRSRRWYPIQIRTMAPTTPEIDSYRNKRVEAGRRLREARARVDVLEPVGAVDRDAPGQGRRAAVQLLVEPVPPPRDRLHDEQAGRDDVGPAQERDALVAGVEERRDRAGDDPAVHPEARVRRQEDLDRVGPVQRVPLVDDVVGAAADEGGDGDDDHAVAQDVRVLAGSTGQPHHHEIRGRKSDGVPETVPADRERTELDGGRVRDEVEHPRQCSGRGPEARAGQAEVGPILRSPALSAPPPYTRTR